MRQLNVAFLNKIVRYYILLRNAFLLFGTTLGRTVSVVCCILTDILLATCYGYLQLIFASLLILALPIQPLAQEVEQFYQDGGARVLAAKPGELQEKDLRVISKLYYPKLSVAARDRILLLKDEIELRAKKSGGIERLRQLANRHLSLGAYANVILGDYYWNRSKETASFSIARPYYIKALELVRDSPQFVYDIITRVLSNVSSPKWLSRSDSVSYGAFGNFLPAKELEPLVSLVESTDLTGLLELRIAQSKSRQGEPVEEICNSINRVLEGKESGELKAEALLLLSQYAGVSCRDKLSSQEVLQSIIREYGNTDYPAVVQARALLKVEQKVVFSLDIEPKEGSTEIPLPKVIKLTGIKTKRTLLSISELGLLTNNGLSSKRVEITPWIVAPEKIIQTFFNVTRRVFSENSSPGIYNNLNILPSGPYLVSAGGEEHYALNTELLLLISRQKDKLFIQSVSLKTGSVIPDVRLEVHVRTPNGLSSSRRTTVIQSDVTGLTSIANPKKACIAVQECDSSEVVIIGQKFRHLGVLGIDYERIVWPFEGDPEFWIIPSSKKVKAGEAITWNLIARPDVFPRFSQSVIQYTLIHPTGVKVGRRSSEFDKFGRAAGVTRVSRSFSPGAYILEVKILSNLTGEMEQIMYPITVE